MRKALLALAFAGSALAAAAAAAQTPPPPPGPMAADADHGRVITRADYLADAARRFAQMDANHDGRVTPDERMAYRDAMRDRRIADGAAPPPAPDGRHEGRGLGGPGGGREITREDYMARAAERFDRMDANHDGRIDRTEMANMREMRHERRDGEAPPPPPAPGAQ